MIISSEPEIAARVEQILHNEETLLSFPHGRFRQFQAEPAKVTVCIPVYNANLSLGRCLDSVLAQIGTDFQILIVDNASTDTTFGDACRLAAAHDNILVVQNPSNIGRIPNWNRCLDLATGDYIKFVMVHDTLVPDTLACLARTMDRFPTVTLACSRLFVREPGGNVHLANMLPMSMILPSDTALDYGMLQGNIVSGPTMQMLRRSTIIAHGLRFDGDYPWGADCVLTQQLLLHGDYAYVHEGGGVMDHAAVRFHNQARTPLKLHDQFHVLLYCFRETGARPDKAEAFVARLQREYEAHCALTQDAGEHAEMEQMFVAALRQVEQCLTTQVRRAA